MTASVPLRGNLKTKFRNPILDSPLGRGEHVPCQFKRAIAPGPRRKPDRRESLSGLLNSPVSKELAQHGGAIFLEDAAPNLDPMIQLRVVENRQDRTPGAGLRVLGAKDDAPKPRLHDSTRAHGARFDCNI